MACSPLLVMSLLLSCALCASAGFARPHAHRRRSGPSLHPNTVGAFVNRMNAYVESDDGRLKILEQVLPTLGAHVAEFFNFYNTNDELATTAEDMSLSKEEFSRVFGVTKEDLQVTPAWGLEAEGKEYNFGEFMCRRFDKGDTAEDCGVEHDEVNLGMGASAAGHAVSRPAADRDLNGEVDSTEQSAVFAHMPSIRTVDPVNDLGSKFGFAFRHNASGSFGLAGGAQEQLGFEAIVGLINLFEPTAESYDFAAEKLDGVELLGCVTAPLLLNAFHLLDDSVKEIETGENGELEYDEVKRLLSSADPKTPLLYYKMLLGAKEEDKVGVIATDFEGGLDPDGSNSLGFRELAQVNQRISRRCSEMLFIHGGADLLTASENDEAIDALKEKDFFAEGFEWTKAMYNKAFKA